MLQRKVVARREGVLHQGFFGVPQDFRVEWEKKKKATAFNLPGFWGAERGDKKQK